MKHLTAKGGILTMNQTTTAANPLGYERIGKLLRSYGATNIIAPITMIAIAIGSLFGTR